MKQFGMLVLACVLAAAAWWWFTTEMPRRAHERALAAQAAERADTLYRWRDDAGNLQVTQEPPGGGRTYERISRQPREGMAVHGDRK